MMRERLRVIWSRMVAVLIAVAMLFGFGVTAAQADESTAQADAPVAKADDPVTTKVNHNAVVLVLDTSKDMKKLVPDSTTNETKLDREFVAARRLAKAIFANDSQARVGVVYFGLNVGGFGDANACPVGMASDEKTVSACLNGHDAYGSPNTKRGLEEAEKLLDGVQDTDTVHYVKSVVTMSGEKAWNISPCWNGNDCEDVAADSIKQAGKMTAKGVDLYSVGVYPDADGRFFLQLLQNKGDKGYYEMNNFGDLVDLFGITAEILYVDEVQYTPLGGYHAKNSNGQITATLRVTLNRSTGIGGKDVKLESVKVTLPEPLSFSPDKKEPTREFVQDMETSWAPSTWDSWYLATAPMKFYVISNTTKWLGDLNATIDVKSSIGEKPYTTGIPVTVDDVDSDGDALPDSWELADDATADRLGIPHLKSLGADPKVKDVFVETDWLEQSSKSVVAAQRGDDGTIARSFQPSPVAMETVCKVFADHKIHLHVDAGPGTRNGCTTDSDDWGDHVLVKHWGDRNEKSGKIEESRASMIADVTKQPDYMEMFTWDSSQLSWNWSQFNSLSEKNFDATRERAFHYAIYGAWFAHGNSSSGITDGKDLKIGQHFFIAEKVIEDIGNGLQSSTNTFMHELGHSLGLGHGGGDNENYKPNYLSIMNYRFQNGGLYVGKYPKGMSEKDQIAYALDYSEHSLPTIDENHLDESKGVDPEGVYKDSKPKVGTIWSCLTGGILGIGAKHDVGKKYPVAGNTDFNCNGNDTEKDVSVNVNYAPDSLDTGKTLLTGFADWPNLRFDAGSIGRTASDEKVSSSANTGSEKGMSLDNAIKMDALAQPGKGFVKVRGPYTVYRGVSGQHVLVDVSNPNHAGHDYTVKVEGDLLAEPYVTKVHVSGSTSLPLSYSRLKVPVTEVSANGSHRLTVTVTGENNSITTATADIDVYSPTDAEKQQVLDALKDGSLKVDSGVAQEIRTSLGDTSTPSDGVTPQAPSRKGNVVSIPVQDGVEYVNGADNKVLSGDITLQKGQTLKVSAKAKKGTSFAEGVTTEWTFTFQESASPTVTGVKVTAKPAKTKYEVGETFSSDGLQVSKNLSDGTSAKLDSKDYALTAKSETDKPVDLAKPFEKSAVGKVTVTVTLNSDPKKIATFTVTVVDKDQPKPPTPNPSPEPEPSPSPNPTPTPTPTVTAVPVYRVYDRNSGLHHYTTSRAERDHLVRLGWRDEGVAWYVDSTASTEVYRLYNPNSGEHVYTTSKVEYENVGRAGWHKEGVAWKSLK